MSIAILAVGLSPGFQKTLVFDNFSMGEVNRSSSVYTDASGKCVNVCRVLHQAGVSSACLTVAGRENRDSFQRLCNRDGLDMRIVEVAGRLRTCTTILDKGRGECTELVVNEPERVQPREEEDFKTAFLALLPEVSKAVVVSGSCLPGFSEDIIPFMMEETKTRGLFFCADYRGRHLQASFRDRAVCPDCVKINEEEFLQTFPGEELEEGLRCQSRKYNSDFLISRGARSSLAARDGKIFEIPSRQVETVNPIGCGDAMTAGLCQGLVEGLSLKDAALKGRDYAALNAARIRPGWIFPD